MGLNVAHPFRHCVDDIIMTVYFTVDARLTGTLVTGYEVL